MNRKEHGEIGLIAFILYSYLFFSIINHNFLPIATFALMPVEGFIVTSVSFFSIINHNFLPIATTTGGLISTIDIKNIATFIAFMAVSLGSAMPDFLEPARSCWHRDKYHSKRALKLTAKVFAVTAVIGLFAFFFYLFFIFYVISNFFLGYALHLLADSTTKVGLPD